MNTNKIELIPPAEIERRSMEIIEQELKSKGCIIDSENASVIKRVIHATADFDFAKNLVFSKNAVFIMKRLIADGANICTDTQMAKAGIKFILNFAAVYLSAPKGVAVHNENISLTLAMLARRGA